MTPYLARIDLYPVKSLDGISVPTAEVLTSGALRHDRAFALFDHHGRVVNGKRDGRIHQVRSRFSANVAEITLWTAAATTAVTFPLSAELDQIAAWFSDYFQQPLTLQQNLETGFPDDLESPGPTIISTATLQAVAAWYGLSLEATRQRFRTNLEISGVPAFWEDQLFSASGAPVTFHVGAVEFQGINPCQRCVVPTRDPQTGVATTSFQKRFVQQRAATLPEGVARSRFNHFYRLAVNTRVSPGSAGTTLQVGDAVIGAELL